MKNIDKYNDTLPKSELFKDVFTEEDTKKLFSNLPLLQHAMRYSQKYRTETEMRVSVLNDMKLPDADSKYWQCMREIKMQSEAVFSLNFEYRKKMLDKEVLCSDIEELAKGVEEDSIQGVPLRMKKLELEKLNFELLNMELEAKDRIREIGLWAGIMEELSPILKYSKEDANEHQLLSYTTRFINEYIAYKNNPHRLHIGEIKNLIGLLNNSLVSVKEKGLMADLLNSLPKDTKEYLINNNILQIGE